MIADRIAIQLDRFNGLEAAKKSLRNIFASLIANHQEGIMIKSDESTYNNKGVPWVKVRILRPCY
jgi:DNA ligase 4